MSLVAWLDVGYSVLIDGADSQWRQLIDAVCEADTADDMELGIAALVAESKWRREQHDKVTAKQRQESGAPTHLRSMSQEAIDAAVAEVASWAGVPRKPSAEADQE